MVWVVKWSGKSYAFEGKMSWQEKVVCILNLRACQSIKAPFSLYLNLVHHHHSVIVQVLKKSSCIDYLIRILYRLST